MSLFRKREAQGLSEQAAEQMLANVFEQCGRTPNNVPLSVLISYSNYRKERYAFQRSLITVILAVFLLLPLFFMAPTVVVTLLNPDVNENPVYGVEVATTIPIREIRAKLLGQTLPMYEAESHEYVVTPNANGELNISVTLLNRHNTTLDICVTTVDADAPVLLKTEMYTGQIVFFVEDEDSGVCYTKTSVTVEGGDEPLPFGYNEKKGTVSVYYPSKVMEVRIPDNRGNVLFLRINPED